MGVAMAITRDIPTFNPRIYTRIALNDLVTYAVFFLSETGEEITAEDIVAGCFLLFPERFALRGYSQWPDSSVVNKRWVDCRKKGLISGSTAQGFELTPSGLKLAENVGKTLQGKRPTRTPSGAEGRVRAETRTRAGRFVRSIEESDAYKAFKDKGENAQVSEFDFRSMLLCTMETSSSILRNNLEQFKQYVSLYKREDLLELLNFCERRFASLLAEMPQQDRQYEGGMLRRKKKQIAR